MSQNTRTKGWDGNRLRTPDVESRIGQAITTIRREKNITQGQIAQHLGVTFQAVQRYEKGLSRLSLSTALGLCEILGVSIQRLIQVAEDVNPKTIGYTKAEEPS